MGQYTVKHQRDRTCADCKFYDFNTFEDSFGEWTEENCDKGRLEYVNRYSEPCEDFEEM